MPKIRFCLLFAALLPLFSSTASADESGLIPTDPKPGKPVIKISPSPPTDHAIVITFDDGPRRKILPEILDFLDEEDIKGTFFVVGHQLDDPNKAIREENRALVLRASKRHEIGNHTYGHGALCSMMSKKMRERPDIKCLKKKKSYLDAVRKDAKVIEEVTGTRPLFFRPPHWLLAEKNKTLGVKDPVTLKSFCGEKFSSDQVYKEEIICMAYLPQMHDDVSLSPEYRRVRDVDTEDYDFHERYVKNPKEARDALVKKVRRLIAERERGRVYTHILAFHELPVSLDALRVLVPEWQERGYRFITLRRAWGI